MYLSLGISEGLGLLLMLPPVRLSILTVPTGVTLKVRVEGWSYLEVRVCLLRHPALDFFFFVRSSAWEYVSAAAWNHIKSYLDLGSNILINIPETSTNLWFNNYFLLRKTGTIENRLF